MEKGLPKAEMKSLYDDILSFFYHFLIALSFIPAFIKLLSGQIFFFLNRLEEEETITFVYHNVRCVSMSKSICGIIFNSKIRQKMGP